MPYSWRRGGGTGLHAEAALLAQLLAMRCPSWNAAPLVYISWYFSDAFIDLQRSYGKNDRLAHCFPKTSHKPEALILILPLESPVGWIKNHFQFSSCHFNLKKKRCTRTKAYLKQCLLNYKTPFLWGIQNRTRGGFSLCSLSSCAMRRRGSPPARWQVLGKGGPLAPSTQTCSQNRINRGHYPHRSSTPVCTLFYPNRIIIISEGKIKISGKKNLKKTERKTKGG